MDDVLIVGAGPAGLAAGIANCQSRALPRDYLSRDNQSRDNQSRDHTGAEVTVCVLERNAEPGRKFRLSGSGQCNVTHGGKIADFLNHYGGQQKSRFVKPALFSFDNSAVIRFFEQRGVPLFEREDGKVFPQSLNSADLLNVLVTELKERGGQLQTETAVENVAKIDGGFLVSTNRGEFRTKKLILACGGCSYPATGSQGDGFRFAESLGHRIVKPAPALTPIIVQNYPFSDSAGISFPSPKIEIHRNGKRLTAGQGNVLLTHRGLSGPGILDLSRFVEPNDVIFVSIIEPEKFTAEIFSGKRTLKNALQPLAVPENFLLQILKNINIFPGQPAAEVYLETRKKLETALTAFPFTVEKLGDWNEAMVTRGGVVLEEVNRQTMESRLVPGLFFCGEILDIDGDTGGYNIQFALSSGFLTRGKHHV